MSVLYAVAGQPCNLGELCARTGLPRTTAHRLAVGLEVHRLLARDVDGLLAIPQITCKDFTAAEIRS